MTLKVYLAANNLKIKEFCKILDVSPSYLSRILWGHIKPGRKLKRTIERATNGQVTFSEVEPQTQQNVQK